MTFLNEPNAGLLLMKVGLHAGETFDHILERKRQEYKNAGVIFWGYGGNTCHPTRAVQPFARMKLEKRENIYIVMEEINSNHPPTKIVAEEYSVDGIHWQPIPTGIEVRSSRYAVVLDELQDGDLDIDLSEYKVAVGPSLGKVASDYILGRVDKACITKSQEPLAHRPPQIKKISHIARIVEPYAVFLRNH
ncbi:MAG: hypothetical protein M0Q01_11485 [Syntrophales bacterium]|jgi:hypothetical protein|nr:hypothetical protein [Syntrophales bacterium]